VTSKGEKVVVLHPSPDKSSQKFRELVITWFELYSGQLLRYARRMLPVSESEEDVLQDIFCRVLQYQLPEKINNPQAFLMVVARNTVIDRLRKISSHPHSDETTEDVYLNQQVLTQSEMLIAIDKALHEIPNKSRLIFKLRRFEGMTTAEVASHLNISHRAVQKHLAKAMAHLYEQLV